jgi:hypothetical protein
MEKDPLMIGDRKATKEEVEEAVKYVNWEEAV